jgi:hypothetical protein
MKSRVQLSKEKIMNKLLAVAVALMFSSSVFAATHAAAETPADMSAVKSSKSLVDAKADMRGMGGMEASKSGKPAVKSGKPLVKTKADMRGMGGMEASKSGKPAAKSGKPLAETKADMRGMGGIEGNK